MSDPLSTKIENRLATLKQEFEAGQQQVAAMEARLDELRSTLLRISGAIQVLEEVSHTPDVTQIDRATPHAVKA